MRTQIIYHMRIPQNRLSRTLSCIASSMLFKYTHSIDMIFGKISQGIRLHFGGIQGMGIKVQQCLRIQKKHFYMTSQPFFSQIGDVIVVSYNSGSFTCPGR